MTEPTTINMDDYGAWEWEGDSADWQHVVSIDPGLGYDWATLHAFWSPSARLYFWHGDGGCSCNGWGDDICTEADMKSGDRNALLRAIREFAEDYPHYLYSADVLDAVGAVRRFKEARA